MEYSNLDEGEKVSSICISYGGLMAQDGGVSLAVVVLGVSGECTQGLIKAQIWLGGPCGLNLRGGMVS